MPPLDRSRILDLLAGDRFVREVVVAERTGSTNDDAMRLLESGASHGTVLVAASQTAGRGRLGRPWHSAPEVGLYLSVLFRPGTALEDLTRFTVASGLAACEACRTCAGVETVIEWPNDLTFGGRKVAGTLAELRSAGGQASGLVIGTGFNVNHAPDDFPVELRGRATSLRMARGGSPVERESLAAAYVRSLGRVAGRLTSGAWTEVAAEWTRLAPAASGRMVVVLPEPGGTRARLRGTTAGIDDRGALLVTREDGGGTVRVRLAESVVFEEA